ncbi:S-adenosyl-L-methionine-dependent methyltransferase [Dimargaris cristalligena]|uniref:Protein arginine methyltransferase NDUFAF7 n=1 Tax=Dimargaris cristalligena TaxID=215637 RepID=A0A4P9ZZA6_9FUNG|nr:S-adenosyl-L-methionine-dependent methyltransferase [Dimargaris cristalligena]|eukprot:RKP39085.1 S-adenosyl-L-methionine-dependent methyltransferase [Dimargaris cristalligena]
MTTLLPFRMAAYSRLARLGPNGPLLPLVKVGRFHQSAKRLILDNTGRTIAKSSVISEGKEKLTPVGQILLETIKTSGPVSVSHFIRQALQSPMGGYYKKGKDVLGVEGDFITSPEISQMFGELIGVWFTANWRGRQSKLPVRVIELGPGRGTLMKDMLRAMSRFPDLFSRIEHVHLVESSAELARIQHTTLGVDDSAGQQDHAHQTLSPISWHDSLSDIDLSEPAYNIVLAHEFFDALPIYKFQLTDRGWREVLVDIDEGQEHPWHFRYVLNPHPSMATKTILSPDRFPASQYRTGDTVEISPDAWGVAHSIAKLIQEQEGCALVIDYGDNHSFADSFRGIRKHKFIHPLSSPGEIDLTFDVDFSLLQNAVGDLATCHGPIQQNHFLGRMGIELRLQKLIQNAPNKESANELVEGFNRLVDPMFMGKVYKAMAITEPDYLPVAFES